MRITEIEIRNILGTKYLTFKPGSLTVLRGRNGSGKTSILDALRKTFEGGHSPNMLRIGSKFGEVILTLDTGAKIRMRVTISGTTYEVTDEKGEPVKSPRAYISELGDALAIDPAQLLLAKPKQLAATLLEIMPILFAQAELQEATGEECWIVNTDQDLAGVEALEKQIYESRTAANRDLGKAETTVIQLRTSLPPAEGDCDWNARVKELRTVLEEAKQSREAAIAQIDREERDAIDGIKQEAQRKIDQAKEVARNLRAVQDAEYAPTLDKIKAAVSEAETRSRDSDRAEGVRNLIARNEKDAAEFKRISNNLTDALENLKELKSRKLADLPIPGLTVSEGQVYLDGVPFEHVNLAERIKIAFHICALRAGKLPFLILDQAEALDTEMFEAFCEGAKNSNFQIIVARVSGDVDSLRIETEDTAQPALVAV